MVGNILFCLTVFVACVSVIGRPNKQHDDQSFPFCSRQCWGATPPTDTRPIQTPVPYVVIHHTAVPAACNTSAQCQQDMKSMQNYHNSLGWGDIGYQLCSCNAVRWTWYCNQDGLHRTQLNVGFCVGGDGVAYEGRGWNVIGIHAIQANNYSIAICLIGDWRYETPPAIQLSTTKALIKSGVQLGVLSQSYHVIGHSQVLATDCPGEALYNEISTWDHFQPGHVDFTKFFPKNKKT